MKKFLFFVLFISICSFCFSQNNVKKMEEIVNLCNSKSNSIEWLGKVHVYLNGDGKTVTVRRFGKVDEEYKLEDIPAKYFCVKNETGFDYSYNLPCLYAGKYGLINVDGVIVEPFDWEESRYWFKPVSSGNVSIFHKGSDEPCNSLTIYFITDKDTGEKIKVRKLNSYDIR